MSLVIPPFVNYQEPMFPLRGLWRAPPIEGDKFITCAIEWGVTTGNTTCVQFNVGGNSPVPLSQIVALNVDNSRNGSDISFLFPDSAAQLVVPRLNQGVYPVFTNALTFYCMSEQASVGDITIFQICNSIPPPVAVQPFQAQSVAIADELNVGAAGVQQLIPPPATGTLQGFSLTAAATDAPASPQQGILQLIDGTGRILWRGLLQWDAGAITAGPVNVTGLSQRFYQGLQLQVVETSIPSATADMNVYYSIP